MVSLVGARVTAERQVAVRSIYHRARGAWHACSACPIDSERLLTYLSPAIAKAAERLLYVSFRPIHGDRGLFAVKRPSSRRVHGKSCYPAWSIDCEALVVRCYYGDYVSGGRLRALC